MKIAALVNCDISGHSLLLWIFWQTLIRKCTNAEKISADRDEDMKHLLVKFIENKLGIIDAENLGFQRVHHIGNSIAHEGNQSKELLFFHATQTASMSCQVQKKLKGTDYSISADSPKEIADRRKEKICIFKDRKEDGKSAYFSQAQLDILFMV